MTDPAIEAAQRAWESRTITAHFNADIYRNEIASAREALKPIRATYTRWESAFGGMRGEVPEMVQVFLDDLAPLIFTTEELKR